MNLAENLTDSVARDPDRTALRLEDAELSYAQLDDASACRRAAPAKGLWPATGSGSCSPTSPTSRSFYYGVLRAGGVVVPMNVLLKGREVNFYPDSEAKLTSPGAASPRRPRPARPRRAPSPSWWSRASSDALLGQAEPDGEIAGRADDDTAVLLYTSGTTGTPKGAELTHANLVRNVQTSTVLFDLSGDMILGAPRRCSTPSARPAA